MTYASLVVVPAEAFAELLNDAAMPATLLPLLSACVLLNEQTCWKATDHLPREADAVASLIERRTHPQMKSAMLRHHALHSLSAAMGRLLARPAMDDPPPPRDPADFMVLAAAEALGAQRIADAWIRGDAQAIDDLLQFLCLPDEPR